MISATKKQNAIFHVNDLSFEDNFNPSIQDTVASPTLISTETRNENMYNEKTTLSSTSPKEPLVKKVSQTRLETASPLMVYALRLQHGDELRKTLIDYVRKLDLKAAFILTCVGSALSAKLRLANAAPNTEAHYMLDIVHPTEIVSLEGTISNGGHMHVALSDSAGKMCGGHLVELVIDTTAEVVIGECGAFKFNRIFDERTGFKELTVDER